MFVIPHSQLYEVIMCQVWESATLSSHLPWEEPLVATYISTRDENHKMTCVPWDFHAAVYVSCLICLSFCWGCRTNGQKRNVKMASENIPFVSCQCCQVSSLVLQRGSLQNAVLFWLLAEKNHQILCKVTALLFWMHATTQGYPLLSSRWPLLSICVTLIMNKSSWKGHELINIRSNEAWRMLFNHLWGYFSY